MPSLRSLGSGSHVLGKGARLSGLQKLACVDAAEQFDQLGDQARPSGLVTGAQSCAVVSMEILIEENVVLPIRIGLELLRPTIDRPSAGLILKKNPRQTVSDFSATSNRFIWFPEPVGHSILKLSP